MSGHVDPVDPMLLDLPRLVPGNPATVGQPEQKIPGQLTRFHTVGTGTHLSPGTMGGSHDQVVL